MGRESTLYVILGMAISLISLALYFGMLAFGERLFGIDPKQAEYYYLRLFAQVIQWLFALVANFFADKFIVFRKVHCTHRESMTQFCRFTATKVITLMVDTVIIFSIVWLLNKTGFTGTSIFSFTLDADVVAKVTGGSATMIANFFVTRRVVFGKKKADAALAGE